MGFRAVRRDDGDVEPEEQRGTAAIIEASSRPISA